VLLIGTEERPLQHMFLLRLLIREENHDMQFEIATTSIRKQYFHVSPSFVRWRHTMYTHPKAVFWLSQCVRPTIRAAYISSDWLGEGINRTPLLTTCERHAQSPTHMHTRLHADRLKLQCVDADWAPASSQSKSQFTLCPRFRVASHYGNIYRLAGATSPVQCV
jgi:hypothetical protein